MRQCFQALYHGGTMSKQDRLNYLKGYLKRKKKTKQGFLVEYLDIRPLCPVIQLHKDKTNHDK